MRRCVIDIIVDVCGLGSFERILSLKLTDLFDGTKALANFMMATMMTIVQRIMQ
jgi:hypothetical protein